MLPPRVLQQRRRVRSQSSADGRVEQFLFDLRVDAQHLADAAGERIELLGRGARELGEQFLGEPVIAPEHAERIRRNVFVASSSEVSSWKVVH